MDHAKAKEGRRRRRRHPRRRRCQAPPEALARLLPLRRKGLRRRQPRRVVKRTFAWIMQCRRLPGGYEQLTAAPETLTTTVAIATLVMRAAQPFSSHIRSEARQSRGSSPTRFGLLRRRRRLRTAPQRCVTMLQQHASFLSCAMSEFMLRRTAAWDTNLRRWPAALWRRYLPCTAHSRKSSDC